MFNSRQNPEKIYLMYLSGSFIFHITGAHGNIINRQKILSNMKFNYNFNNLNKINKIKQFVIKTLSVLKN